MVTATDGIAAAAMAAHHVAAGNRPGSFRTGAPPSRPSWWVEEIGLPTEFMRDVSALVGRGESFRVLAFGTTRETRSRLVTPTA